MRKKSRKNWVRVPFGSIAIMALMVACDSQGGPEPQNQNVVNATIGVQPVAPGALDNEAVNYGQGNVTPGEQGDIHAVEQPKPEAVVQQFADLLSKKRFADAFGFVDAQAMGVTEKQFEAKFKDYKTIDAAVGTIGPMEGAAGSIYSTIQLTLSGNKNDGSFYVMTGPLTLRRVNDVPGSTAEQRRWHIVKTDLTANPKAAKAKLNG
jgi:hypothetical protein